MLQVVQSIGSGETKVTQLPTPLAQAGEVLVAVGASLISAGTERYVVELAKKSLLAKARERPDHVRRVVQKMRREGLLQVATQVRAKLAEPMPLGYSAAGVVLACGSGVQELKPGERVAVAAPHAEVVAVGKNLCAPVPESLSLEQASYAAVGAIALEGVRLARVSLGEKVLVIGLGLVGRLTVALLKAQGCRVFGVDVDAGKLQATPAFAADVSAVGSPHQQAMQFSQGYGVDAVIITAATESNQPIEFAAEVTRVRGRIVLVGVSGLQLPRAPFFAKELQFTVSSSLGPGRSDFSYEERGIDYPIGHARWTAQRNMAAVLDTIAAGKLPVEELTSHRFAIEDAARAYELITDRNQALCGVVLTYPEAPASDAFLLQRRLALQPTSRRRAPAADQVRIGLIGAGNYARLLLLPHLARREDVSLQGICTAKGMNAVTTGETYGFAYATTEVDELLADSSIDALVIATRHDLHAPLVLRALRAGKHVFVEKPLCIQADELGAIEACVDELGSTCPVLTVGFNRRFAAATAQLRAHFAGVEGLSVSFRFAPGPLPRNTWPQDLEVGGGRLIGEACHAIDTCTAILGSPPQRVYAESVRGGFEAGSSDDRAMISLAHANGSIAQIAYQAGGDAGGPAERIEVFGGGRTAILDDWRRLDLWADGHCRRTRIGSDKGHRGELAAFFAACQGRAAWPIEWRQTYGVAWASIMAMRSLREGMPIAMS